MIESERLGRPYYECPDCAYSSMDKAYVEAHIAGSHKADQQPGAEAGPADESPSEAPIPESPEEPQ